METVDRQVLLQFFFLVTCRPERFVSKAIRNAIPREDMAKPKLIIHLDINGTIMPADPIQSKNVETMLNIHLSKQAFVRRMAKEDASTNDIVWWTGAPFHTGAVAPLLPQFRYTCHISEHYREELSGGEYPFEESVLLHDFNSVQAGEACEDFTSKGSPGFVYKPVLETLLKNLEWKHPMAEPGITEALTLEMKSGSHHDQRMSLFVPAFVYLLQYLYERKDEQDYVLVIRTFGSDIPRLTPAFNLIAQGKHPDIPAAGCIKEPHAFGNLSRSVNGEFSLDFNSSENQAIHSSERIMEYFESLDSGSVVMVCDDYECWRANNFDPVFGKPVFIDLSEETRRDHIRHFLFDDNVNMNPKDSIAAVWLKQRFGSTTFEPLALSSEKGKAMIGTVLLQANLFYSILDREAFVKELLRANNRYNSLRHRLANL